MTETLLMGIWTANNNVRQLDIAETKLPPNITLILYNERESILLPVRAVCGVYDLFSMYKL